MAIENGIFVPVIIGLIEIAKRIGLPSNFSPLVAIGLGIALSLLSSQVIIFETIIGGIVSGLAASGLYSGTKSVIGK